jgi:DNA-binding GntR family transcriptional regulator
MKVKERLLGTDVPDFCRIPAFGRNLPLTFTTNYYIMFIVYNARCTRTRRMTLPIPTETPAYRDLSEWVATKILDAIDRSSLKPGERLVEQDIAEKFSVSRTPVREALYKLEKLGVVHRRGRATYVNTWAAEDIIETILLLDALILLSVQLGINRLQPGDLAELEEIVEETRAIASERPSYTGRLLALELKFHMAIARRSGHRRLIELIENLSLPIKLYYDDYLANVGRFTTLRTHENLLEALKHEDLDQAETYLRRAARDSQAALVEVIEKRSSSRQEMVDVG